MDQIESPCIGVCSLKDGVCQGCYRYAKEVENWDNFTNEEKQEIINRINHDLFD